MVENRALAQTALAWPTGRLRSRLECWVVVAVYATDTYLTTYAATDPPLSAGGAVELDGFFGWPLAAAAS